MATSPYPTQRSMIPRVASERQRGCQRQNLNTLSDNITAIQTAKDNHDVFYRSPRPSFSAWLGPKTKTGKLCGGEHRNKERAIREPKAPSASVFRRSKVPNTPTTGLNPKHHVFCIWLLVLGFYPDFSVDRFW